MPSLLSIRSLSVLAPEADSRLFFTQYCSTPAALVMLRELNALSPPLSRPDKEAKELVLLPADPFPLEDLFSSPATLLTESIQLPAAWAKPEDSTADKAKATISRGCLNIIRKTPVINRTSPTARQPPRLKGLSMPDKRRFVRASAPFSAPRAVLSDNSAGGARQTPSRAYFRPARL